MYSGLFFCNRRLCVSRITRVSIRRPLVNHKNRRDTMSIKNESVYTIQTKNRKLLEVGDFSHEDGGSVRIWTPADSDTQHWRLMEHSDGLYRIINVFSDKALDIAMQGSENGTIVHQWESTDTESQLWSFADVGSDCYKIISKSTGKCLDLMEMGSEDGTTVQIWEDVDGEMQTWKIAEIADACESQTRNGKAKARNGKAAASRPEEPTGGKTPALV